MRCIPISEPAASSNQLTRSRKRDVIIDSFQRTLNFQSNSHVHENLYAHNTYTTFWHSMQSTPPGYSERRKEAKKRYSLKNLQERLIKHNDVNAVIESSVYLKFRFSQSNILTTTTCIAHCLSSDFALGKKRAPAFACSYLELQQMRRTSFHLFFTRHFSPLLRSATSTFQLQFSDKKTIFPQTHI